MRTRAVHYHAGQFPPRQLEWERLIPLLGPTAAAVARYDGVLAAVPNPGVLLSPLTTQEAVLSSRIEGTQATFDEVLEYEAAGGAGDRPPARVADIQEVLNYRSALREAEHLMADLPLCMRVILAAHRQLMDGVRGHGKSPGELRRVPNWLGPHGCTIEEARFVPIAAGDLAVSRDGDWTGWCRFFLEATRKQAEANHQKASDILALYASMKPRLHEMTRSQYVVHALDWIFERPIVSSSDFVAEAGIPAPTARRVLALLQRNQVLRVITAAKGRRAAMLAFPDLLNIAEGSRVF
jgi:Fic family protein